MNKNKKTNKLINKNLIFFVVLLVWFSICSVALTNSTREYEEENILETLQDVSNNNSKSVELQFKHYENSLVLFCDYFLNIEENDQYFIKAINDLVNIEGFYKIVVFEENGSYEANGETILVATYEPLEEMESKEIFISDVFVDSASGESVVSVNVPMISDSGDLIAYISGFVSTKKLSEVFNSTLYEIDGYYQIVDGNGNYVAVSSTDNMIIKYGLLFEKMAEFEFTDGFTYQEFINDVENKEEGLTKYCKGSEERYAYYTPVDINDWIVFEVVNADNVEANISKHLNDTTLYVINVCIVFIIFVVWVVLSQKREFKNKIENERKFRLVSNAINKFFVEVDFKTKEITILGDYQKKLNRKQDKTNIFDDINNGFIFSEDVKALDEKISQENLDEKLTDLQLRIQNPQGEYIWHSLSLVPLLDEKGKQTEKAIGFLEDINDIVTHTKFLTEKSEIDALTGIYNKGTTEYKIKEIIENSNEEDFHALFIIDIDNLKTLNDTLGHQIGDKAIKDVANILKKLFRQDDVIGRVGGDEFFVFMKHANSKDQIIQKAEMICNKLNRTYKNKEKSVGISASIGVSIYPKEATKFEKLYKNADLALYDAKQNGKSTYKMYNGQSNSNYVSTRTKIDN